MKRKKRDAQNLVIASRERGRSVAMALRQIYDASDGATRENLTDAITDLLHSYSMTYSDVRECAENAISHYMSEQKSATESSAPRSFCELCGMNHEEDMHR